MKVKLSILVDAVKALQKLNDSDALDVEVAYTVSKNTTEIDNELKAFYEIRNKLFKKYGEEKEDKGKKFTQIKKENIETFNEEINKLLAKMSNVSVQKIKLADLKGTKLTPFELKSLDFLLKI